MRAFSHCRENPYDMRTFASRSGTAPGDAAVRKRNSAVPAGYDRDVLADRDVVDPATRGAAMGSKANVPCRWNTDGEDGALAYRLVENVMGVLVGEFDGEFDWRSPDSPTTIALLGSTRRSDAATADRLEPRVNVSGIAPPSPVTLTGLMPTTYPELGAPEMVVTEVAALEYRVAMLVDTEEEGPIAPGAPVAPIPRSGGAYGLYAGRQQGCQFILRCVYTLE